MRPSDTLVGVLMTQLQPAASGRGRQGNDSVRDEENPSSGAVGASLKGAGEEGAASSSGYVSVEGVPPEGQGGVRVRASSVSGSAQQNASYSAWGPLLGRWARR